PPPHPAPPPETPPPDEPRTRRRRGRGVLAALLLIVAAGVFAAFVYPGAERIASLLRPVGEAVGGGTNAAPEPAEDAGVDWGLTGAEPGTSRDGGASSAADAAPSDTEEGEAPGGAADEPGAEPPPTAGGDGDEAGAEPPSDALAWDDVVYFAADSAFLLPPARRTLDSFARALPDDDAWTLEVVGHTARVGSAATSQALSEERAEAVADYLLERLDPDPRSVVVRGMGARDPEASNATPEGRELNRRVEIFARERQ
ncbi:MAG: OmpA family protein, partial [Spirochaetota bacterium]